MPRACSICVHCRRDEIDKALLAGQPLRDIAGRVPVAKSALHRHKGHVSAALERAAKKQEEARGDRLLSQLLDLQRRTMELLAEADRSLGGIDGAESTMKRVKVGGPPVSPSRCAGIRAPRRAGRSAHRRAMAVTQQRAS